MTPIGASVVVISHGRPFYLRRCLTALSQLDYHPFEIVTVADGAGLVAISTLPFADRIKTVAYEEANVAGARNAGISVAGGEIVAFIDDDSVPEPTWLRHLLEVFEQPDVQAAGGFVLGRNGISLQWRAREVDDSAYHHDLAPASDQAFVQETPPGRAVKTEGTNCAFRRKTLLEVGGFDSAFRYFLDETDLNMRLARMGAKTALNPAAIVHHASALSASRDPARMPKDLSQIGASLAAFLRKHGSAPGTIPAPHEADQRKRLLRHMVAGNCEPDQIERLLHTLRSGYREGLSRRIGQYGRFEESPTFRPFQDRVIRVRRIALAARTSHRRAIHEAAKREVAEGARVTALLLSHTSLYHQIVFHPDGYWLQTGGIYGKSDRRDPLFRWTTFRKRVQRELDRIASVRPVDEVRFG